MPATPERAPKEQKKPHKEPPPATAAILATRNPALRLCQRARQAGGLYKY